MDIGIPLASQIAAQGLSGALNVVLIYFLVKLYNDGKEAEKVNREEQKAMFDKAVASMNDAARALDAMKSAAIVQAEANKSLADIVRWKR